MLVAGWEGTDFVSSNRWQTRNNLIIIWISLHGNMQSQEYVFTNYVEGLVIHCSGLAVQSDA